MIDFHLATCGCEGRNNRNMVSTERIFKAKKNLYGCGGSNSRNMSPSRSNERIFKTKNNQDDCGIIVFALFYSFIE